MALQKNACGLDIDKRYLYINKHTHVGCPETMLDALDFTGVELFDHIKGILNQYGLKGQQKKMLEVGSRHQGTYHDEQAFWDLEYHNLNLENPYNSERTVIGDITNCPQIPDAKYDFVYSMDTFEHIAEPWKAASEIARILKPGGVAFIVTLFSWRYHPDPIDYWRFSPACLKFLFKQLNCIEANWDIKNRRVPLQGTGNDVCPEDHFGPWMENWRVFYIGRKV